MKYTCITVDDERPALKLLQAYIAKLPHLELVASCENAGQTIAALQKYRPDLMFLDIQMPDLTGLELLQTLKNKPQVILTTAYREYAVEGFALDVTDYLVKPFSFERFVQGCNKGIDLINLNNQAKPKTKAIQNPSIEKIETATPDHFFVKSSHKMERIEFSEIRYIESMREYVDIHTGDRRYIIHQTMNSMEEKLPSEDFMRVHRSFMVSLKFINQIVGNTLRIGEKEIPIGGSYRKIFFEKVNLL